jgi:hypothetical protein
VQIHLTGLWGSEGLVGVRLWPTVLGYGQREGTVSVPAATFWEQYELARTLEAFQIKRRTLYHWRRRETLRIAKPTMKLSSGYW